MERDDWEQIVAVIAANWPHMPPPDASIDKWFIDLRDLPAEQVLSAVETFNREGVDYPPNGGKIRQRVVELGEDEADDAEAWSLAKKASLKVDPKAGLAWLEERSPAAAETVRQLFSGVLSYQLDDETTARAQFREGFKKIVGRRKREESWKGLPSGGLKTLERVADGHAGMRKIAVEPAAPAALTKGEDDDVR